MHILPALGGIPSLGYGKHDGMSRRLVDDSFASWRLRAGLSKMVENSIDVSTNCPTKCLVMFFLNWC